MQRQDSTDPTGVSRDAPTGSSALARARNRKAASALQMALAGTEWEDIAIVLGYPTARHAKIAVERALEAELHESSREKLRQMAGQRLQRLLRGVWPKAINEDHPDQMLAVLRAQGIISDYVKLYGLAAPTEMVIHSPTTVELERWVSTAVRNKVPQLEEADIFDVEVVEGEEEEPDALPSE